MHLYTPRFPRKPYSIPDQNGQSVYPFSEQNGAETPPDGAAHTYMTNMREFPPGFDVNLKMTEQINKTCQSVYNHLHNIRQIRKFLTPASTKLLVQGVIVAHIDYCNGLLYGVPAVHLSMWHSWATCLWFFFSVASMGRLMAL